MDMNTNFDINTFKLPELPPIALKRSDFAQKILNMGSEVSETIASIELSAKLDIASHINNQNIDIYA